MAKLTSGFDRTAMQFNDPLADGFSKGCCTSDLPGTVNQQRLAAVTVFPCLQGCFCFPLHTCGIAWKTAYVEKSMNLMIYMLIKI